MKKPIIGIYGLTSCEGCQFALLDLGEKFLKLTEVFEIGDFKLVEAWKDKPAYDIVFVDGTPMTAENIKELRKIRKKSKLLVSLGDCAVTGCIQRIKNYQNKEQKIKYVYKNIKRIDNFEIKPIKDYVKVDFEIPGCPITGPEFLRIVYYYLAGVQPKIFKRPVCYECQLNETECLLQKGEACLGPVILGGCDAICTQAGYRCEGCRGLLPEASLINFVKCLEKVINKKDLDEMLQKFGIKDQWDEVLTYSKIKNKVSKR